MLGMEAKTIHRLLEIDPATGRFSRNESNTLACGLLVVDETSMVDVPLMHSLLRAVPNRAGLVLVGDVDQLLFSGIMLDFDLYRSTLCSCTRGSQ